MVAHETSDVFGMTRRPIAMVGDACATHAYQTLEITSRADLPGVMAPPRASRRDSRDRNRHVATGRITKSGVLRGQGFATRA
jgi:hypothetical protein